MEGSEGTPIPNYEEIYRNMQIAEKLVKGADGSTSNEPITIPMTPDGRMKSLTLADLISDQEAISLTDAQQGDVVWWQDENDHNGYFAVTKPYKIDEKSNYTYGAGALKVETDSGQVQSEERRDGWIIGAGYGGMVRLFHVAKNTPVQFVLPGPTPEQPQYYRTAPIKQMGIIKRGSLKTGV